VLPRILMSTIHRAAATRADLRGAGLRGAGLRGAGLRGAGLRGAGLRGAGLRGAGLRGAGLRRTSLVTHDEALIGAARSSGKGDVVIGFRAPPTRGGTAFRDALFCRDGGAEQLCRHSRADLSCRYSRAEQSVRKSRSARPLSYEELLGRDGRGRPAAARPPRYQRSA
jgi:uncharacterized protein YjbI with pentapeptide repeats